MDAFIEFIAFISFTAFITLIALSECFSFIYAFLFNHVLSHLFDSIPLHSTPLHCIPFLAAPSTRTFGDAAPPNPYWAWLRMHPFHSIPFINVIHYHSFIHSCIYYISFYYISFHWLNHCISLRRHSMTCAFKAPSYRPLMFHSNYSFQNFPRRPGYLLAQL